MKMTQQVAALPDVIGIGCVYLPVSDAYASARWYCENFGLESSPNTPLRPGMPHAILLYKAGGPGVFLLTAEQIPSAPLLQRNGEEMLACCLLVRDIEATLSHLKSNGVRLEAEAPVDRVSCGIKLRCYDPDGNKLELVQPAG
jgi:catechol 2,3-dioxygenase-like lactoylglutathione lyase family enzyme